MEQKVMIEVGTTELQKALDKMIEGIVIHEMREGVEKLIAENFDAVVKPKLESSYIDRVVDKVVREGLGYDYYNNLRKKANETITSLATDAVKQGLSEALQARIIDTLSYSINTTVRKSVEVEIKKVIAEEVESQVKEMVKEILAKAIMGK